MAAVVLVVRLEDGEGLLSGDAGVVGALSGLNGLRDLGGCIAHDIISNLVPQDQFEDMLVLQRITHQSRPER